MEEYAERLEELCTLHGVIPTNIFDLSHHDFHGDADEVREILNEMSELYYEKCDFEEN